MNKNGRINGGKNQALFNSNAEINKKTEAGTADLLSNPLKFGIIRKDSGGRVLAAEIRCDNFGFQVINILYMPSLYPNQSKKEKAFFNQIYDFINVSSTRLLIGDFNDNFFVYLHEKHTKILDSNLEKQGRIVKSQKKEKTHIYIQKKNNEIIIYFSHLIHD